MIYYYVFDIQMNEKDILLGTLKEFSAIAGLIGEDWFLRELDEGSKHPLITYLAKGRPNYSKIEHLNEELKKTEDGPVKASTMLIIYELQYHFFVLAHLNHCLEVLNGEPRLGEILDHLTCEDHFWNGYSEAEIGSLLKEKFGEIELAPTLPNGKSADVKFKVEGTWIYAEVTTPEKGQKFSEIMKQAIATEEAVKLDDSTGRVRQKIHEEFEHFRSILGGVPAIVFVNTNQCEYDDLDIEDALMGTPKLVIHTNNATGEVKTFWERDSWTVFEEDEKAETLGGIISYERNFTNTGKVVFDARIFAISFSKKDIEPLVSLLQT